MKYKLLNQDMTTYDGFQWEVGKTYTIDKPGNELCTDQVFHCYYSPETAAIFNRLHANISDPICYAVETADIVADDGLKLGTKSMKLISRVELPTFTDRQYRLFAIKAARFAMKRANITIPQWDKWADLYENDSATPAAAYAVYAAYASYAATAAAAYDAAAAAAYAAAYDAAAAAAYAAAYDAAAYACTSSQFALFAKQALEAD